MSDATTPETPDEQVEGQLTLDEQAGYRDVLDDEAGDELAATDPNLAAAQGDYNHEDHIGEPVDDDLGVGAAGARLDAGPA